MTLLAGLPPDSWWHLADRAEEQKKSPLPRSKPGQPAPRELRPDEVDAYFAARYGAKKKRKGSSAPSTGQTVATPADG